MYVDTHAGRGKHKGGQEGSPLVALRTFLDHSWRDKILKRCEVQFIFIEWSKLNVSNLTNKIRALGELPTNIGYSIYHQNAFELLEGFADELEKTGANLAPCFMFLDPYGFDIPCDLLRRIKSHSNSELLITLIWRELDMAMRQKTRPAGLTETINRVFGGKEWEDICLRSDSDDRGEAAVQLLKDKIGAQWVTYIRMLGDNQKTRYFLLHLTDHKVGRDLMKQVVWKCCPENGYYARKKDDPNQEYLIKPEPDLTGLRNWLLAKLSRKTYSWNELTEILREEIWLNKHLWHEVKELKNANRIKPTNFNGRFSQKANPTLSLAANGT